jgi:hypothetical protein
MLSGVSITTCCRLVACAVWCEFIPIPPSQGCGAAVMPVHRAIKRAQSGWRSFPSGILRCCPSSLAASLVTELSAP